MNDFPPYLYKINKISNQRHPTFKSPKKLKYGEFSLILKFSIIPTKVSENQAFLVPLFS